MQASLKAPNIVFYASFLALVLVFSDFSMLNASAWRLSKNQWSGQDERVYSDFVAAIGKSKYSNLNKFIKSPKANPLYGEEDKKINLSCDCADLPYVIRAYVAYKLRLPFSYTSAISGKGGDERYSRGNKPVEFKDQDYFNSPQHLFNQVKLVNSGYYRTAASCENSDFYPLKINKSSIVPGVVYYDPDGHVALVSEVTPEGRIRLIDAHPDKTISKPWFGAKFSRGSKSNGGGFKYWRPVFYTASGHTVRTKNHNIQNYSAEDQFKKSYSFNGKGPVSYYDYIRFSLAVDGRELNPLNEFVFMMNDIYEDIKYRALAVNICIEHGINKRSHPGALPWNIYGTSGLWEEYSTPSRDARLKVAFRDFYDRARQLVIQAAGTGGYKCARALAMAFLQKYNELSPHLAIFYINSFGQRVNLSFNDVCLRLFDLSFDPYHSIELRWGEGLDSIQSGIDSELKRRFYTLEAALRNRLERVYNTPTPLAMGPKQPPSVDICAWLADFLNGKRVDTSFVAFNRETVAAVCYNASQSAELLKRQTAALPTPNAEEPAFGAARAVLPTLNTAEPAFGAARAVLPTLNTEEPVFNTARAVLPTLNDAKPAELTPIFEFPLPKDEIEAALNTNKLSRGKHANTAQLKLPIACAAQIKLNEPITAFVETTKAQIRVNRPNGLDKPDGLSEPNELNGLSGLDKPDGLSEPNELNGLSGLDKPNGLSEPNELNRLNGLDKPDGLSEPNELNGLSGLDKPDGLSELNGLSEPRVKKLPAFFSISKQPKTGLSALFDMGDRLACALMNKNDSFEPINGQNED